MLNLTRRPTETVYIGDIAVTIKRVRGKKVLLSIDAPADVPIRRNLPETPPAVCSPAPESLEYAQDAG
jgi:carbon storage regulator CsrA